jgi:hypothetical protein
LALLPPVIKWRAKNKLAACLPMVRHFTWLAVLAGKSCLPLRHLCAYIDTTLIVYHPDDENLLKRVAIDTSRVFCMFWTPRFTICARTTTMSTTTKCWFRVLSLQHMNVNPKCEKLSEKPIMRTTTSDACPRSREIKDDVGSKGKADKRKNCSTCNSLWSLSRMPMKGNVAWQAMNATYHQSSEWSSAVW